MFFSSKKQLSRSQKQKTFNDWTINFAFASVVTISVSFLVFESFNMISNSILDHAKESSKELIKQTTKNIQAVLEELDDFAMRISRNNSLANSVLKHDSIVDEQEKLKNLEVIESVLNKFCKERQGIAEISVVTRKDNYIINEYPQPAFDTDIPLHHAVDALRKGDKKSLWLDTYNMDIDPKFSETENGQVFSIVKGIYSLSSLKSQELLSVNIKESYLYSLISDVKLLEESDIFIIGRSGNYVINARDRKLNGQFADYDFIKEILKRKNGEDIRKVNGRDCLVTYNTIEEIRGTELKWTIVGITPVSSITKGVTDVKTKLLFIGFACMVFGLVVSTIATRRYNSKVDKKYAEEHSIVIERERLASLGQMIGGIAHNFKTPIMSISGGLEAISDLIDEYDNSIGDADVTREDHHEIASEIAEWVGKIKPYCSYMSDIISAVKGQTTNLNDSTNLSFTLKELIKRVKILMDHELRKNKCNLNIEIKINQDKKIAGEINNLVQILNNLISNSIEAYNGDGGEVDLIISEKGNNLEIVERDYGCGIPENVKERLLKEMITTKGKNGTGLGLYMSYSTIKGKFGGSMVIESEEGKGTSIIISIPCT